MLRLYIPVGVTVLLIASMTYWESVYSDRFTSSSVDAEEFGKRFANVPTKVGPWVGTDTEEDALTLEQAGAVSHVSRTYINSENPNDRVDLWLIVGHAREICRHTPDICYPSHGFAQLGSRLKHQIDAGEEPATFFTAKFRDESALGGQQRTRVFWAWNGNNPDKEQEKWEAPEYQKLHFGNNTALYKMYFTAQMRAPDEPVEDSVAIDFAELMIPEVNRALFPDRYQGEPSAPADAEGDESAEADAAAPTDPASAEAAPGETSGHASAEAATAPADAEATE